VLRQLVAQVRLDLGHSPAAMLYMTVSRTVPSRRSAWWRSTPSLAPRRSMAACEAWLKLSVRRPTSAAPSVSNVRQQQLAGGVDVGALQRRVPGVADLERPMAATMSW
jgi:hypothetical protein